MIRDDSINFYTQLKKGKVGEEIYKLLLKSKHLTLLESAIGYQPAYDLKYLNSKGNIIHVEVKTDYLKTDNVAIEFKSKGQSSGIESTKAEYFAVVNIEDKLIYIADTNKLRTYINDFRKAIDIRQNRKNDSGTWIYLIPKFEFKDSFLAVSYDHLEDHQKILDTHLEAA